MTQEFERIRLSPSTMKFENNFLIFLILLIVCGELGYVLPRDIPEENKFSLLFGGCFAIGFLLLLLYRLKIVFLEKDTLYVSGLGKPFEIGVYDIKNVKRFALRAQFYIKVKFENSERKGTFWIQEDNTFDKEKNVLHVITVAMEKYKKPEYLN